MRSIKMIRTAAFLRALAAANPAKPPPTITTQGTLSGIAYFLSLATSSSKRMGTALAWFMPGPFGIALPRGKKLKTLVFLTRHNILKNREFVAISPRIAERGGAEKMISAKQAKARARSSPAAVSIYKVAGRLGDHVQVVDRGYRHLDRPDLAKACCEMSRMDGTIGAWHEVPLEFGLRGGMTPSRW